MDLTIDEMIDELDNIMEAMSYHDDRLLIALELAQTLRDELIRHTDDFDEEE